MTEKSEKTEQPPETGPTAGGDQNHSEGEGALKKKHAPKKIHDRAHHLEEQLQALKKEKEELNDKYLRVLAEMDNFRKRVTKEKEEFQKYVLTDFLLSLLQVYDNLARALAVKEPGNEIAVISGIEITFKQFVDILKAFQVQEIDALGKPFDPELHQALAKEEREGITTPTVIEIYQRGFLYNNRLLRPALIKVAVPKPQEEPEFE